MIITDKFVYIHMPKTGGTFTTCVLTRLHQLPRPLSFSARTLRRVIRKLGVKTAVCSSTKYGPIADIEPKHGTCHDIPEPYQDKPILSTLRSPYEWYVSQYEFGWWKRTFMYHPESHPTPAGYAIEEALPAFQAAHPHFPNLTFVEFIDLCCQAASIYDHDDLHRFGLYTHVLVKFFFRSPADALASLDLSYLESKHHRTDMFDVRFVMTHDLNQQLRDRLLEFGYDAEDLDFISSLGRILPEGRGRSEDQGWQAYYDQDLMLRISQIDWPALEIFPEFSA